MTEFAFDRNRRAVLAALSSLAAAAVLPGCASAPPSALPVVPSRAPRVGDTWRYVVQQGWKNEPPIAVAVRCTQVGANAITDSLSVQGSTVGDTRTFSSNWEIAQRTLGGGAGVFEFSPYLTAFGDVPTGQRFQVAMPPMQIGSAWSATAQATGTETVVTGAGTFEAIRISISANRPFVSGMDNAIDPVYIVATAWLAPAAKRLARFTLESFAQLNNPLTRQDYSLASLSLI
jgi:hypothetical protein